MSYPNSFTCAPTVPSNILNFDSDSDSDVDFSEASTTTKVGRSKQKRKNDSDTSRRQLSFAQPSPMDDSTKPTSSPSSAPAQTTSATLAGHHGHEWARRGIRHSLFVPDGAVPDHASTIYFDTGDRNLNPLPYWSMRGDWFLDDDDKPREGFIACPRFDLNDDFIKHAFSLRQTPVSRLARLSNGCSPLISPFFLAGRGERSSWFRRFPSLSQVLPKVPNGLLRCLGNIC